MDRTVCINAVPTLWKRSGVGRYTDEVTKHLLSIEPSLDYKYFYGVFPCSSSYSNKNSYLGLAGKVLAKMSRKLPFCSGLYDIYWEPNFIPNPKIKSKRCITTIHDLSFIRFQEMHPSRRIKEFRRYFLDSLRRADIITTVSEYVKTSIINDLNIESDRVKVIPCGVNENTFYKVTDQAALRSFRAGSELPAKYILYVGSIEPRKNLLNLLKAYDSMEEDFKKEFSLVMAGFMGWKNSEIKKWMSKTGVVFIQNAADKDLRLLYNYAEFFIFPSIDEGFGLPPLEAMACGTPCVVSNSASLPEVCGDAAWYVDPNNIDEMMEGMRALAVNRELRTSLIEKGYRNSSKYTWKRSAMEYLNLFEKMA